MWFPADIIRDVKGQVTVSLKYHSTECRGHPYASRWYTWPVLAHPVLFYVGSPLSQTGQSDTAYITNLGNPAIWWLAIPALLFCCIAMTTGRNWVLRLAPLALLSVSLALMALSFHDAEKKASVAVEVHPSVLFTIGLTGMLLTGAITLYCAVLLRRTAPALILLGFLAAWMMWVPGNEQRVLFLYHMLGALPFMALALAYALSALRTTVVRAGSLEIPLRPFAYAGLGVVVAAFVFFYPIWTGAGQPTADHDLRMWFESWVQGWN
jgi:dolichyl-phosphate-mannose--protein O-mannosyl transferase